MNISPSLNPTSAACKQVVRVPPFEQARQLAAGEDIDADDLSRPATERERLLRSLRDDDLELMQKQLWYAGRRGNISPLHHQRVIRREIVLTERARLHLVWFERIIYIKRLGDELTNWTYFSDIACRDETVYQVATGFLLSYMYLIQYPSDLEIAKEIGLINTGITWPSWRAFRASVLHHLDGRDVHDRFEYGELRLGRLNQIYRMRFLGISYFTIHRDYRSYFGDNYMALVAVFALASVALSAMQVMTAYDRLPEVAMVTIYRFSIATLVAITASCAILFVLYVGLYFWNWLLIFSRRRSRSGGGIS